jgi:RNA 2',3'-cyclic 3'-phosphodiesterase
VRLFVGVELDDAQRARCAQAAFALQTQLAGLRRLNVRWIPDDNLHITLWFLGELEAEPAERVLEALRTSWIIEPFSLAIAGAGAFPSSGPPRIFWFGVSEGADPLAQMYQDLAARFGPLGHGAERRAYHPHVTVGRVKDADRVASRKARGVLRDFVVNAGRRRVTTVTLFRSRLSPSGARYEALLRVPLKGC